MNKHPESFRQAPLDVATTLINEAQNRIAVANRWILGFFFVLLVTWLNFADDLSAGERGLPSKRISEASDAASRTYQACQAVGPKCNGNEERGNLREKLKAINDDIDFVVFKIKSVDLKYQSVFVIFVSFFVLFYIRWNRQRVLKLQTSAILIIKYDLNAVEPPPGLIIM